ncbi:sodium/panthothenate symporter [Methyloligella halotolerans]|uniref:Sodium/panthothenate symporter n=1 Tax=Methyloligella halotolerans TaxID=1177755 RepID=A0A1E2S3P2_9HYPH|nr:sodium:solute symporter [Methyloligella halotolerans]ODA69061.1 sodium/panthothenate symporter [Methyloligella halotolerans]
MDKAALALSPGLTTGLGLCLMIVPGVIFLGIAYLIRRNLVHNTHDFIISNRRVGLGFGVGSIISVWTWAMAVMMSSAMTFQWGLSGLFWFVVPNGLAVMAVIPLARILRRRMPEGYTISEFVFHRFGQSQIATTVVTATMIFGILLEILINLKGTSVVMSTVFPIDWRWATLLTVAVVLTYSYFGGLWTAVMTGTINTWMITVPAAIVVVAVFSQIDGGATAVFSAVEASDPTDLSIFQGAAASGFGITLAFGLLAATVADQTFWQKVWALRPNQVGRTFMLSGMLFYPIPICLGALGLVGLAYGLTPEDIGGDIVAIGPYVVSHLGLPMAIIIAYVFVILAACYSTIDGASSALSSIVAVDIVKRFFPGTTESTLFYVTKLSMLLGGIIAAAIVLSGVDFTSLVLTTYALKTSILLPLVLAIAWPRTNTIGFVAGIALAIAIGMPLRSVYGDLIGTLTILGISGGVVVTAGLLLNKTFDMAKLTEDEPLSDDQLSQAKG